MSQGKNLIWQKFNPKIFASRSFNMPRQKERLVSSFSFLALLKSKEHPYIENFPKEGIFMTGIESSDPWVEDQRRNQLLEAHNFYENFEDRLNKIHQLGIRWLRFGPPYSEAHKSPGEYDFTFMDKVVAKCRELNIEIIADLLHFGLPAWLHEQNPEQPFFQNSHFPEEFAKYALVFAWRYSSIKYYTIVNEPFVTANFSSKLGLWNEKKVSGWQDDAAFTKAAANIARAAILGRQKITAVWQEENRLGEPIFVQNESFEKAFAEQGSGREKEAERFNLRRFMALDLIFGHANKKMCRYLQSQGMSKEDYGWFMENGSKKNTILGIDHYPWCVHTYQSSRSIDHSPTQDYQLYNLTKEYWLRYRLPLLHTEINAWPEHAGSLMLQTYDALSKLRREGYPMLGMTWYGDEYQVGWQSALCGEQGFAETPVGLYYKGQGQPVAEIFKDIIASGFPPISKKNYFNFPFRQLIFEAVEILNR